MAPIITNRLPKRFFGILRHLSLTLLFALLAQWGVAQDDNVQTKGREFWAGFMQNYVVEAGEELNIYISAEVNTTGTVEIPGQGWSQNFTANANQTATVTVPNNIAEHFSSEQIEQRGIRITTADTASVFSINFNQYTADGARILPLQTLGSEYRISSYEGLGSYTSEFLIIATEDQTEVEITPTAPTAGGNVAGVPFTVVLDQGESYQVQASGSGTDFTGTVVRSTNNLGGPKKIAVFGGVNCVNVPVGCSACDHIYDQMFPTDTWGTDFTLIPFSFTTAYTYRVMAHEDNTSFTVNGGAPVTLNAGQFQEYNGVNSVQCISSDNIVSITQYMQGASCASQGDPAMTQINDNSHTIHQVAFTTMISNIVTSHGLNLVIATADVGQLNLDGAAIPAGQFAPVPSCPELSYAQITIPEGNHTLDAPNGFIGYLYGAGLYETYLYSLGSYTPTPDCFGTPGGSAYIDECGECVEGETGLEPCVPGCTDGDACNFDPEATSDDGSCEYLIDCAGVCGGTSIVDDCGVCYDPLDDGIVIQEFSFTGGAQTFTVPFGVDSLFVELYGGQGGGSVGCDINDVQDDGGLGGYASGNILVAEGDVYYLYVGGQGGLNGVAGWNGGGAGGQFAGGGGGGSDIRTTLGFLGTRIVVAGGGGGGSYGCGNDYGSGGNGGGLTGDPGVALLGGNPGGGGGTISGGAAGSAPSASGSFGSGGSNPQTHVAGGGGGWYGGGAAHQAGAGGGSSYIAGVEDGATESGIHTGNGLIRITFRVEIPPCEFDCNDVLNGDAYIDECGTCVEGDTGLEPCIPGCTDPVACNYNPDATDEDGSCAYEFDCNGTCGGTWVTNECGICYDAEGEEPFCEEGCDGEFYTDPEQVPVVDCFGICGGGAVIDECGECGGNNESCTDCAGEINGNSIEDNCGNCYDPADFPVDSTVFDFTGAVQSFEVPEGVTSINIRTWGAQGANSNSCVDGEDFQIDGGLGGYSEGDLLVSPGDLLYVYVGGQGSIGGQGGWNGGGSGGNFGGGGGGASDVRTTLGSLISRVIVAGGGGAGNTGCPDAGAGGAGGGLTGDAGTALNGNNPGGGGTQAAGGTAGSVPAQPGGFGNGGGVFSSGVSGGGGGWYGGGAAYQAGGGGGSSYTDGVNNAMTEAGVNEGNGQIIVYYQTLPECTLGCTDPEAINYDPSATDDDGSCEFEGCTDPLAANFDPAATVDDGSCLYEGCTDPNAINFDPDADIDDGSCIIEGCTDPEAANFNPDANQDDGTCEYPGCTNPEAVNYDPTATIDDGSCIIEGCTIDWAVNYNPEATVDDGSCTCGDVLGCTDPEAANYNEQATIDDGSCVPFVQGCTDWTANNFNPDADQDDGSCTYDIYGCMDIQALNYDPAANIDNGACEMPRPGCMDPAALNYQVYANVEDNSLCAYGEDGEIYCGPDTFWDPEIEQCVPFNECPADLNGDLIVNSADLLIFLSFYSLTCTDIGE